MFSLVKGSVTLTVKNHIPLAELLESQGLPASHIRDCNYFKYWALPHIPGGKFLVSEREWLEGGFEVGTFSLVVADEHQTKTFENCYMKNIFYVQGANEAGSGDMTVFTPTDPPGPTEYGGGQGRLLIVDIELRCEYNQYKVLIPIVKEPPDLVDEFDEGGSLLPTLFSLPEDTDYAFIGIERPYNYYPAYIAHTHFLTAYVSASGGASRKATLTKESITNTDNDGSPVTPVIDQTIETNSLLTSKVAINEINLDFKLLVVTTENPVDDMLESAEQTIYGEENYLYKSNTLSQLEFLTGGDFYYPWVVLEDTGSGGTIQEKIDAIAESIKENAKTRVCIIIDLLFLGVIATDPTNDAQRITYSFSEIGLTTRIETEPWLPWNPYAIPNGVGVGTTSKNIRGVLVSDMVPEDETIQMESIVPMNGTYMGDDPLEVLNVMKWYGKTGNVVKAEWNANYDNGLDESDSPLPKGKYELYSIEINYTLECPTTE